jgi:hypothetical protein
VPAEAGKKKLKIENEKGIISHREHRKHREEKR